MSRVSRVPYHQNVYDLLGIEPGECPEAARMVAEHEADHGPLPASVREWYLVPNVVPLVTATGAPALRGAGTLWHDYLPQKAKVWGGYGYVIPSLEDVLQQIAIERDGESPRFVRVLSTWGNYRRTWVVELTGSDDPPVWMPPAPRLRDNGDDTCPFSAFVSERFGMYYASTFCPHLERVSEFTKLPHGNRLWLRTPDEPFHPPVIDFLIEHLGEPEVTPRAGNVSTYTWRPPGGTLRVTADEPTLAGGLSAWWVHAETPERLAEFARLLLPWGTLRDTLRADTDPARDVLRPVLE